MASSASSHMIHFAAHRATQFHATAPSQPASCRINRSFFHSCHKSKKDLWTRQSFPKDTKNNCHRWRFSTLGSIGSMHKKEGSMQEEEGAFCSEKTPRSSAEQCPWPEPSPVPDQWVEDSVFEIVRNIEEAPFIHLVFDAKDSTIRTERRRVSKDHLSTFDCWRALKELLAKAAPDGLIVVRHLDEEAIGRCCMEDLVEELSSSTEVENHPEGNCSGTDMWGVLVLRRSTTGSACYILKTTRVASSLGICTRFCLTRAKCFGPSWIDQLQSSWLIQTDFYN